MTDLTPLERFNEILDEIEKKVEDQRAKALSLIEEQVNCEKVLKTLSQSAAEDELLSDIDKEELAATITRLQSRLANVVIEVKTSRNESQVEALQKVNGKIDDLIEKIQVDLPEAKVTAEMYLNSCSVGNGSKFESLLLSCTSDDQKAVRERITSIVENINALDNNDNAAMCDN